MSRRTRIRLIHEFIPYFCLFFAVRKTGDLKAGGAAAGAAAAGAVAAA